MALPPHFVNNMTLHNFLGCNIWSHSFSAHTIELASISVLNMASEYIIVFMISVYHRIHPRVESLY